MPIITNKAAVRRSLEQWFILAREGKTLGSRETAELSAHDAAAMSSDYFYDLLVNDEDSMPAKASEAVDLIAAEDIAAGQFVAIDNDGKVIAAQSVGPLEDETGPVAGADTDFFGG